MNIYNLLQMATKIGASDLHITSNRPATIRLNGEIKDMNEKILNEEDILYITKEIINEEEFEILKENGDFELILENLGDRYRINIYKQKNSYAISIRIISQRELSLKKLNLPTSIENLANKNKGLILVTGSTGSGKSTTISSIINYINDTKNKHIITLEDPIEYIHKHKKSIVHQREIGKDVESFSRAFRSILRQDPDIIFIGEIRDKETMSIALKSAETGHLVLSTLHTNGAANTVDRIVSMYEGESKDNIRHQFSDVCIGIIAMQLVKTIDNKQIPAVEIMLMNEAIKSLIRENKIHQIQNIIQTNTNQGMQTMDFYLVNLFKRNIISKEELIKKCVNCDYVNNVINFKVRE